MGGSKLLLELVENETVLSLLVVGGGGGEHCLLLLWFVRVDFYGYCA